MPQVTAQKNNSTAAIIFAVFAVACIVAFLAYRGNDVGHLRQLLGNLGGGPLVGYVGLRDSVIGAFIAILIGICWFGVGTIVARFALFERAADHSHVLELARNTSIGAVVWSVIWYFLGSAGLYNSVTSSVCIAIGLACSLPAIREIRSARNESRLPARPTGFDRLLLGSIAIPVIITFIAALAPPTAKDTLLYHYAVPKAFVLQQSSSFIDGNIASYLALGNEMQYLWAMLQGRIVSLGVAEASAGGTSFLFFVLLLMVVFGWAREIGISRIWALIAPLIIATVPTAYHVVSSGYIDLSLALYVTLATYSLTRWWKDQTWGWVMLIAIFLGAALTVKLTAVFVVAAFALVILLRARESKNPVATAPGSDKTAASSSAGKIVTSGFAALVLAGVIASPWYIRTWTATGSPVFPFYMSIWPGKANGWDVERSNLFQSMNSQYGGADTNKLNYLTAPVRASVMAQPEQPAYYDGVLGVAFLIGLPLLIWALWKFDLAVEVKIAVGVAGIMYLFWLFSSEQLRYLLPILPLLAIAIAASAEAIGEKAASVKKVAQCSLVAASVIGILTTFAWFCQRAPLRVVLGGEPRDQYLTRNLDYYPYYQVINADTPPDARVWLINMRRDTYYLDRPVFSDYLFEDWTLRKMIWESRSVEELRAKTKAMGISYVLTRHDFLLDYDRSTIVDDKRPRAENEAKLKIARDFILDPAHIIKADNKFSLIKVL